MYLVSFGDPIVQYSCAMNTQCIQHSFCNCMFVPGRGGTRAQIRILVFVPNKGWKSGYIHRLLFSCQTRDGNLAISKDSCFNAGQVVEKIT